MDQQELSTEPADDANEAQPSFLPSFFPFASLLFSLFPSSLTSAVFDWLCIADFLPLNTPAIGTELKEETEKVGGPQTKIFEPLTIKGVEFKNRLFASPMCMYSSENGHATDWVSFILRAREGRKELFESSSTSHLSSFSFERRSKLIVSFSYIFFSMQHLVHLGSLAVRGIGAICVEASAVVPEGRITPEDAGIWTDSQIAPMKRVVDFVHGQGESCRDELDGTVSGIEQEGGRNGRVGRSIPLRRVFGFLA